MITALDIYLFTRLDSINEFVGAMTFFSVIGIIVSVGGTIYTTLLKNGMARYSDDEETAEKVYPVFKYSLRYTIPLFIIFVLLSLSVPTQKEAAAIYLVPKVANNEKMQQVPDKVMDLFLGKMDEWISDTKKKINK